MDIEFASDGFNLYLLQFRAQSQAAAFAPAPIPRNLSAKWCCFQRTRTFLTVACPTLPTSFMSTRTVMLNCRKFDDLRNVGKAVGRLNKLLPKRQFILIGPGRWGSRGDIRLGVQCTYADISNTAVLIEVAHKKGNYVPELSFGTHFFQDLVESDIRYIPLYPDEPDCALDEKLLRRSPNLLPEVSCLNWRVWPTSFMSWKLDRSRKIASSESC